LVQQTNAGPASARNHGARVAQSDLLLYTDADCIPQPGWVAAFVKAFAGANPPAACMGSYLSRQLEPAARFSQLEFEERYALMEARGGDIDMVATYSAAYRRDIYLESGGFDERFPKANNEDAEFSYRLSLAGHAMRFVRAAQVEHEHDASWASYFRTKMGRGFWRTIVYRRYPEKALRDTYTPNVLKAQLPLSALALLGILLLAVTRRTRFGLLAAPYLISTVPMTRFAAQHAPDVVPWVAWGSFVRALAFVVGVTRAMLFGDDALRPAQEGRSAKRPQPMERNETPSAQEVTG
jgi:GT2 family glycosyltransferase